MQAAVIARSASDEAIQSSFWTLDCFRGACHRAALCADPLARNDGGRLWTWSLRDGPYDQTSDVQLHIGESRDSGFDAHASPRNDSSHVAIGVGMVRKARVTCQNNSRLVASATEWAVPGRMTNWRSPLGSRLKNSSRSATVAIPSCSPRTRSTGESTFSGCTTGRLAVMSR